MRRECASSLITERCHASTTAAIAASTGALAVIQAAAKKETEQNIGAELLALSKKA